MQFRNVEKRLLMRFKVREREGRGREGHKGCGGAPGAGVGVGAGTWTGVGFVMTALSACLAPGRSLFSSVGWPTAQTPQILSACGTLGALPPCPSLGASCPCPPLWPLPIRQDKDPAPLHTLAPLIHPHPMAGQEPRPPEPAGHADGRDVQRPHGGRRSHGGGAGGGGGGGTAAGGLCAAAAVAHPVALRPHGRRVRGAEGLPVARGGDKGGRGVGRRMGRGSEGEYRLGVGGWGVGTGGESGNRQEEHCQTGVRASWPAGALVHCSMPDCGLHPIASMLEL